MMPVANGGMTTPAGPAAAASAAVTTAARPSMTVPPMAASASGDTSLPASAGTGAETPATTSPTASPSNVLERPYDPVVLTGDQLTPVIGTDPTGLVAFRYGGDGQWKQIPLQVDERAKVDYYNIYNKMYSSQRAFVNLVYVDPNTLTGPDTDPKVDADDEVVFIARDAGSKAPAGSAPMGVTAGSGVEVAISDPLSAAAASQAFVYLYLHDGSLKTDAGARYGTYTFKLMSGKYPDTYRFTAGPNPEDTTFKSAMYERHFGDRWLDDVLKVTVGASTGVDILDVHESALPDDCTRLIGSYDAGEGAFVTNKSGAVRSIRSFIGANSGPLTQRTHIYYEQREDIIAELRVHQLPWGAVDTFKYSMEGVGLTYYNVNNKGGALIDGVPDDIKAATNDTPLLWEMVTGAQGTVVIVWDRETDITGMTATSYYLDQKNTTVMQCNGDKMNVFGQSGPQNMGSVPSTDPSAGGTNFQRGFRNLYYLPPNAQVSDAEHINETHRKPLVATLSKAL